MTGTFFSWRTPLRLPVFLPGFASNCNLVLHSRRVTYLRLFSSLSLAPSSTPPPSPYITRQRNMSRSSLDASGPVSPPLAIIRARAAAAAAKPRRRPAPLTLTPPSPAYKCPTNPLDAEQVRGDFIAASFAPTPAPAPTPVPSAARRAHAAAISPRAAAPSGLLALKKAPSKMGMRGLFRAMGSKKGDL